MKRKSSSSKPNRYHLAQRKSKVSVADLAVPHEPGGSVLELLRGLPKQLAAIELLDAAKAIADAHRNKRPVIIGFGGHVIKVGLGSILVDLLSHGIVTGFCTNGAGMIHDFELAAGGKTSEDVDEALSDGSFGFAVETGSFINRAVSEAAKKGIGIGRAVGEAILRAKAPYAKTSVFAQAASRAAPLTVHVALGTDIAHIHPEVDGAAWGKAALDDFRTFCGMVANLEGGVFINMGSAVVLPEVFLKAVTLARNLGKSLKKITTIDMDFIRQYRPQTNVVRRPTSEGGRGISLVGHHEIMGPLLFAAVIEELSGGIRT